MIFSSAVPAHLAKNAALIDYLAGRFTYHSRDEWRSMIVAGKVTCNGRASRPEDAVAAGDIIAYDAGEFEEPPADLSYRIIYEDEWILGIDKPGNLLVHRAGRSFRNNLMFQIRYVHRPPYPSAHAAHRLDRETSGVVCVAKNAEVRAALGLLFAGGKVEKAYVAVVGGAPKTGEINLPVGRTEQSPLSCRHGVLEGGKEARTLIETVKPLGRSHSFVTVRPLTGRTHQIRIHLAAVGSPVVGDRLYGGSAAEPVRRHALHCASLLFIHPVTGKECRLEAALPADMERLMDTLSRSSADVSSMEKQGKRPGGKSIDSIV